MDQQPPESEQQPQGSLPIISDETGKKVIEEIGMDRDRKTKEIITGITGEEEISTDEMLRNLGLNVFSNINDVNPELTRTIQQAIKENLSGGIPFNRSLSAEGMAVVLRAFEIESGFNLVDSFSSLETEDIDRVQAIIAESMGRRKERDLLEEVLEAPKIPEQQITLNQVITQAAHASIAGDNYVRLGAATMYNVLAEMRPKLFTPRNPNTPPDQQGPPSAPPEPGLQEPQVPPSEQS